MTQLSGKPDAVEVAAQFDRVVDALAAKFPAAAEHLADAREDLLAFAASRARSGGKSGATTRRSG